MRSRARVAAVALLVGLACLLALSATALAGTAKQTQVKEGIHSLQVGLQSWAVDHGDRYPRFISNAHFRAALGPYLDSWPLNPNTNRPMRLSRGGGNFGYRLSGDRTRFRLIGWGRDGARIIVVP